MVVDAVVIVVFEHSGRPQDVPLDGLGVRRIRRVDHGPASVLEPARDVHRNGEVLRIARERNGRLEPHRHLGVDLRGKVKSWVVLLASVKTPVTLTLIPWKSGCAVRKALTPGSSSSGCTASSSACTPL